MPSRNLLWEQRARRTPIKSLAFAYSDAILVSASPEHGGTHVWNVEAGTLRHTIPTSQAGAVISSPHHPFVVVCQKSQAAICDVDIGRMFGLRESIHTAAFSPDGRSFIAHSDAADGLRSWSLQSLIEQRERGEEPTVNEKGLLGLVPTSLGGPPVQILPTSDPIEL